MIADAHCHLVGFSEEELVGLEGILIAAVSEDVQDSRRTLELARRRRGTLAFVGIHPWRAADVQEEDLRAVESLVPDAAGLGEIGIDGDHLETMSMQLEVFRRQLRLAREYDKPVNLHCLRAWEECLDLVLRHDVRSAVFHWYTGPRDLAERISGYGFYISINAAAKVQRRHAELAASIPMRSLLVESDGPYEYRGLRLTPLMIPGLLDLISELRGISRESLEHAVAENFHDAFLGR
ncbi:TatD family hydrolase [Conexivisphaera calida]|uniref:Deoxyribonuclease similar to YcfH, type 3 n=1 Tax=Conexivisphaera calida TaxID=1874277 RepID=A0A4P2VP16_9ARCH|nr:TatD family hydrolase [Conexivisphaera calida]BBE42645.1 Putative deoxyribonuclease similar to YcfH, type 3 [Conexivisphaera calida]